MKMKKRLGEILTEIGAISERQLQSALEHQKRYQNRVKLGSSLVSMGFITEDKLTHVMSRYFNLPMVNLSLEFIPPDVVKLVPSDVAEKFDIMPFKIIEENRKKILALAMADPSNLEPIDIIQFQTGLNIRPFVAPPSEVERAIQKYYYGILVDGISYVGKSGVGGEEKVKLIRKGEEVTWHGVEIPPEKTESGVPPKSKTTPAQERVTTSLSADGGEQTIMKDMLKALKESNAIMKVLIKKGIVSEDELSQEIKTEDGEDPKSK